MADTNDQHAQETPSRAQALLDYETDRRAFVLREIAELAIKLVGVFCIVTALPALELPILWIVEPATIWGPQEFLLSIAPFAGYAVAGLILMWKARWLARKLISAPEATVGVPSTTTRELQAVAISLLGIYFMAMALPNIGATLLARNIVVRQSLWSTEIIRSLVPGLLEFCAGLFLFLRAKGIAVVWHRLRSAGNPTDQPEGGS